MKSKTLSSLFALSPLLIFFLVFIGTGIYFSSQGKAYAFYQVSATVAILPAIIFAFFLAKTPFQTTLNTFLEGARDSNIIIMCLIYLLAGAFATVLQNIGGVSSTVHFALNFVPPEAALPALFLIASLVSMAMGTSMGTIAAIGPIGVGIAQSVGLSMPLTMGAIIGGAMFGDNLSMISDTTIAATQIHGCSIIEKFKSNAMIALPAMIMTLCLLSFFAWYSPEVSAFTLSDYQLLHCLPYLVILVLALFGMNVFLVLTIGILVAGGIGVLTIPSYTLITLSQNIFEGYKSMIEILILSLLMGGLGELIKQQGGFVFLTRHLRSYILAKEAKNEVGVKTAEGAISIIAGFSDICTANNTAAIILSGEATKEIAMQNQVPPARAATLVNLFSCVFQGILPYSAQVLMAGSLSGTSPLSIVPHVHYCFFLGLAGMGAIFFQWPRFSLQKKLLSVAD